MKKMEKAIRVLQAAESEIKALITVAAAESDYGSVARLAEVAEVVRGAITKFNNGNKSGETDHSVIGTEQILWRPPDIGSAGESDRGNEYPKFETQEERLIKIGWSKRDGSEYEHKAEKDIVSAVTLYLAEIPKGRIFRMDERLPVEVDGTEVPLYQAYLVLAWLRNLGLVSKQGKDGYQWSVGAFDESAFEAAWDSTPRRQ